VTFTLPLESMSIINGLKQLKNSIGLYEGQSLDHATTEQLELNSTLKDAKFLNCLKKLEEDSYAAMITNLEFVATEGWFDDVLDKHKLADLERKTLQLSGELKSLVQSATRKESTNDKGYIIWLDYRRTDAKGFDPMGRPPILPNISDENEVT
jgi:hypothetical protein